MKRIVFIFIVFLLACFLSAEQASILHYQDSSPVGMGARAMGMGGAFIAIADDATAITWNPGGLPQIEEIEISLVTSVVNIDLLQSALFYNYSNINGYNVEVFESAYYEKGNTTTFDFMGITVPVRPFKDSDIKFVFQYCYQSLANLSMEINSTPKKTYESWREGGRDWWRESYNSRSLDVHTEKFAHSLGVGFQISRWFNIGFSTNIIIGGGDIDVSLQESSTSFNDTGQSWHSIDNIQYKQYEDFDTSLNFNIGALINLPGEISLGIVYKTPYGTDISLRTESDNLLYKSEQRLATNHYPGVYGIGLSFRPIDNLTLAMDFTLTEFSKARIEYHDTGDVFFHPATGLRYDADNDDPRLKQHDSSQLRFGAEYIFIIDEDALIGLRSGIFWDKRYYADYTGNVPTHFGFTAGAGLVWKSIVLDAAIMIASGDELGYGEAVGPTNFSITKLIASVIFRI